MKRFLSIISVLLLCVVCLSAQDDNESILTTDIEVDGFENFWVQSKLLWNENTVADFQQARPAGGNTAFLSHVHRFTSKLFNVLIAKYPDEVIGMVGSTSVMYIQFLVNKDGNVDVLSIENGAKFGFDAEISQKLFDSYRKWRPAKKNGEIIDSTGILELEFSL